MEFNNVYEDEKRAEAYAKLEFPGTYYLAYRDIPELITEHVTGTHALDFGCGTGRSTRFLVNLGFNTVGADISEDMLKLAQNSDPSGDYLLLTSDITDHLPPASFDLVLSAFTFDNIPTSEKKISLFTGLKMLLREGGKIINLVSSPEIYMNEWASFSTKDFPENHLAMSYDKVKIIMTDVEDLRPVEDIIMHEEAYQKVYQSAGLEVVEMAKPLAKDSEPFAWKNETKIAPWTIYVIGCIN